ncbi:MAG: ribosomal protein L15 [Haloquadratum sp. J07HQX50]|jgi:LSU ribosomal protein L15P|nr:MAG: ribosomal protein L15 [Haloquadratum sp. J07HQX50]
MTSKKRRQRGTRTHGGGTHKNRRGAGHRGGRGRAGRDKHNSHNYEPIGKHGFTRPAETQETVAEVTVQELDENAAVYAAKGLAERVDDGYEIDARSVVETNDDVDVIKVLGSGQVRQELHVTADAFTDTAREQLEKAGSAELTDRGITRAEEIEASTTEPTESEE